MEISCHKANYFPAETSLQNSHLELCVILELERRIKKKKKKKKRRGEGKGTGNLDDQKSSTELVDPEKTFLKLQGFKLARTCETGSCHSA